MSSPRCSMVRVQVVMLTRLCCIWSAVLIVARLTANEFCADVNATISALRSTTSTLPPLLESDPGLAVAAAPGSLVLSNPPLLAQKTREKWAYPCSPFLIVLASVDRP